MDYYGTGRSNYVHLTDAEKVKEIAGLYGLSLHKKEGDETYCFISTNEGGDINHYYNSDEDSINRVKELGVGYDENDNELEDFLSVIPEYLIDDEVLIWQHVGNEGSRYSTGSAFGVNNKGQTTTVDLTSEILLKAKDLGTIITSPEY